MREIDFLVKYFTIDLTASPLWKLLECHYVQNHRKLILAGYGRQIPRRRTVKLEPLVIKNVRFLVVVRNRMQCVVDRLRFHRDP